MIWVGGVQGAGKSTVAQVLATAYDLPVHHVDAFTYAHLDRMASAPTLDEQLALGPEAAADWWDRITAGRLALVGQDVAARGLSPVRPSSRVRS